MYRDKAVGYIIGYDSYYLLASLFIIAGFALVSLHAFLTNSPAADELLFIRTTEHLPDLGLHKEWWSLDGVTNPATLSPYAEAENDYSYSYDIPIWYHPYIANYVSYPLVKMLFHEDNIETIMDGIRAMRIVAWLMLISSVIAILYVVRSKTHSNLIILMSTLPLLGCLSFFVDAGNNWFYDTFLVFFLSLSVLVYHSKHRKWAYIPLALMVGSKIYGIAFLVPFLCCNKKYALCSLILVPYLIQSYIATGNPIFSFMHFYGMGSGYGRIADDFRQFIFNRTTALKMGFHNILYLAILMICPVITVAVQAVRRKTESLYLWLFLLASVIGLLWWGAYYHLLPLIVLSMLVMFTFGKIILRKYRIEDVRYSVSVP